jgi:SPX domain protein involved in polyphosphate accumulation
MIQKVNIKQNLRYERKFTATAANRREILHAIKAHPSFFREIYHPRQVNNIYLDTDGLAFFEANRIGVSERKKVRIRWYGDLFDKIQKPTLEFKIKHGLVGDKWSWRLADFELNTDFTLRYLKTKFKESELPAPILESLQNLQPTLLNSYQRTYFLSADGNYRLTLDEQLAYRNIKSSNNLFLQKRTTPNQYVLELKYGLDLDHHVDSVSGGLPFRLDKSSKYVNGIEFLKFV